MNEPGTVLRDEALASAVIALDDVGLPARAKTVEALRDVLHDDPKLAIKLERLVAKKLANPGPGVLR